MGWFRRRRVDLNARSERLGLRNGDLLVMGQLIEAGADLTQPHHALYYVYVPDEHAAVGAAAQARDLGFTVDLRSPDETIAQWAVVCEHPALVLDPDTVRANSDHFEAIADAHGGEYDGWEAAVTAADA